MAAARRTLLTSLCALVFSAACACVAAPKPLMHSAADGAATAKVRQQIQSIYSRQALALPGKDIKGMFAGYAADEVSLRPGGKTDTVAMERQVMAAVLTAMKRGDAKFVVTSVSLQGDGKAVVMVKEHVHMLLAAPGHPPADMVDNNVSRDLWVKTPVGWELKQSRTVSDKTTVNGKAVANG